MRPNRLRELLNADQPSLGTRILSSWPTTVELVGHSGMFDYVEFVAEYAPYDLYALENFGRAIELFDSLSGMMKIEQEPRTYLAIRALGSGFQNLLFADVRSAEDAEECVRAVRAEAPNSRGRHGVGMRRDVGVVLEAGTPEFVAALDEAVVAIMIEKLPAMENLDAILAVDGVDMVQFGPADYSMDLGIPGRTDDPRVQEAERRMIETALAMGVAPRVELLDVEGIAKYQELGVRHFCVGIDVATLFRWYRDAGATLREQLGVAPLLADADEQRVRYGR